MMRAHGADRTRAVRLWGVALVAAAATLGLPALALAHLERPSYFPNPHPDTSISPPAGGEVPDIRSFRSAVTGKGPGEVRVVCKGKTKGKKARRGRKSRRLLKRSIRSVRQSGYRLRPSQPKEKLSKKQAKRLRKKNRKLARKCKFKSIQKAIDKSGNNDRVVIMPGTYTEPKSRAEPTNDPRCEDLTQSTQDGSQAPSYRYQVTCPHDQNLIFLQGRAIGGEPPDPPLANRHGVPDEGPCVRCNMQVEGSGYKPEDVIIDAGTGYQSEAPGAKPGGYAKDIGLRTDRADGFVGRNLFFRGAREHGFYMEETDGAILDRVKFFWNRDYGHLSFATDHNRIQNCEAFGAGDAGVYPGSAAETGSQALKSFYPDAPRINTVITQCDLHGNVLGYSGSMGNAVRVTRNHFYGNVTGMASDTYSAANHPGYPADSVEVDHNYFYSNNLDVYKDDTPVEPLTTPPIGTGILFLGINDIRVHDNWFFDNWRHATMLYAIPDAVSNSGQPEGAINPGVSCSTGDLDINTSCGNRQYDNHLGQVPPGFDFPKALDTFGVPHGSGDGPLPNGTDFFWDEFLTNTGNCWYDNVGPNGTESSVTGPGAGLPPDLLPSDCATSIGLSDLLKEAQLLECGNGPDEDSGPLDCQWWQTPPKPGTAAASAQQREIAAAAKSFERTDEAERLRERIADLTGTDR